MLLFKKKLNTYRNITNNKLSRNKNPGNNKLHFSQKLLPFFYIYLLINSVIHADMTYCSLFVLFNFCTTWLFPFLQKTSRYRSAQFATVVHNSVTTSFCTPWIPFCLFPCAKFLFFYTIYFGDRRMCWIMYWWLQTIRNCCCFKNNMRKCFILKFFFVVRFSWNVCQQKITRHSQQYIG